MRDNLHRNNCPEGKKSGSNGWEQNSKTQPSLFALCQSLAEKIQKICCPYSMKTIFRSSWPLRKYLFRVTLPTEDNMIKNCIYSIPCSCGSVYEGEIYCPVKVKLEEHRKAVVRKVRMIIYEKKKRKHLHLWNKCLKEVAHVTGHSGTSIEINTIWKPIIIIKKN